MLIVDLIAGAVIVGLVAWGAWAGLAGMLALAGFASGAALGAVLAPLVLGGGRRDAFALVVAIPAALVAGALVAAVVERRTVRLRRRLQRRTSAGPANTIGGALLAGWSAVVAVWLGGAVLAQASPLRSAVNESAIVGRLNGAVTPPGPVSSPQDEPFNAFPVVVGPAPEIPPPDAGIVEDPQVLEADRSVVKIGTITECGPGLGSGWIVADGVVATNGHVIAAAEAITVLLGGEGRPYQGTAIWFDSANDIALLRVPKLAGVPALALAPRSPSGTSAALLGFPGARKDIRPARLGETSSTTRGRISYGPGGFPPGLLGRRVTSFRGRSEPGGSGGPLVDGRGRVVATVFAVFLGTERGVAVPNQFVRAALREAGPPVDTGACPEDP